MGRRVDRSDHVTLPGHPLDENGLPILAHVPLAVQIRAVASDAAARALFGHGLDGLSEARCQVAIEIGHAVCDAVAAFQNPDAN